MNQRIDWAPGAKGWALDEDYGWKEATTEGCAPGSWRLLGVTREDGTPAKVVRPVTVFDATGPGAGPKAGQRVLFEGQEWDVESVTIRGPDGVEEPVGGGGIRQAETWARILIVGDGRAPRTVNGWVWRDKCAVLSAP